MVDWYSGFPWIYQINILSTDSITNQLLATFQTFGYPRTIRRDGGPQFRNKFRNFCNNHGIIHEAASPYNPHSNAHAEVTIKSLKQLIIKCSAKEFDAAFSAWKNTSRHTAPSPNSLFFGHSIRLDRPIIDDIQPLTENLHPHEDRLHPIKPGSKVWIQTPQGKWLWKGIIKEINEIGRTYIIKLEDGRIICRNSKFIQICYTASMAVANTQTTTAKPKSNFIIFELN